MMKRISVQFLTGIIVLVLSGVSFGGETYTYTTTAFSYPDGLAHDYAYSWEIDLNSKGFNNDTQIIDSVTLEFHDIYDNTSGDILQISVLDTDDVAIGTYVAEGIDKYYDHNYASNYFTSFYSGVKDGSDNDTLAAELLFSIGSVDSSSNQISVTYNSDKTEEWSIEGDIISHSTYAATYSGNVIDALTAYISGNILTLGLDPDCHYYASSISLILTTSGLNNDEGASHAPEPETLVLFGIGLLGASAFGRKRFSSMG